MTILNHEDPMPKLYADRDASKLEPYYCRHIAAMTVEALHSKSSIAAELAARDQQIERLRQVLVTIAETQGIDHDDVDCPEDDTCRCRNIAEVNSVMRAP